MSLSQAQKATTPRKCRDRRPGTGLLSLLCTVKAQAPMGPPFPSVPELLQHTVYQIIQRLVAVHHETAIEVGSTCVDGRMVCCCEVHQILSPVIKGEEVAVVNVIVGRLPMGDLEHILVEHGHRWVELPGVPIAVAEADFPSDFIDLLPIRPVKDGQIEIVSSGITGHQIGGFGDQKHGVLARSVDQTEHKGLGNLLVVQLVKSTAGVSVGISNFVEPAVKHGGGDDYSMCRIHLSISLFLCYF